MSKIKLGDTYTEKVRYTQANVDTFAQISGDNNPIHINPEYASKSIFGRCIVHGFFAGAVFSKVFGTQWPGEGTAKRRAKSKERGVTANEKVWEEVCRLAAR